MDRTVRCGSLYTQVDAEGYYLHPLYKFFKKQNKLTISVAEDPNPDPPDPHVLGLLDPNPDPLVRGMDPDPDPYPSIIKQK